MKNNRINTNPVLIDSLQMNSAFQRHIFEFSHFPYDPFTFLVLESERSSERKIEYIIRKFRTVKLANAMLQ